MGSSMNPNSQKTKPLVPVTNPDWIPQSLISLGSIKWNQGLMELGSIKEPRSPELRSSFIPREREEGKERKRKRERRVKTDLPRNLIPPFANSLKCQQANIPSGD